MSYLGEIKRLPRASQHADVEGKNRDCENAYPFPESHFANARRRRL